MYYNVTVVYSVMVDKPGGGPYVALKGTEHTMKLKDLAWKYGNVPRIELEAILLNDYDKNRGKKVQAIMQVNNKGSVRVETFKTITNIDPVEIYNKLCQMNGIPGNWKN